MLSTSCDLAGILTFHRANAFPTILENPFVSCQWLSDVSSIMWITAAGTVQVFHLIPLHVSIVNHSFEIIVIPFASVTISIAKVHLICLINKFSQSFFE